MRHKPNILVLLSRVPYPLEKGDKLRAYHQLKHLAADYNIVLCCLNDTKLHPNALTELEPLCYEIHIIQLTRWRIVLNLVRNLFSPKPFQVAYFYHAPAQKQINQLIETHLPKHIYCQLVRVTEYVRHFTVVPKTLDYMDALSKGLERRIAGAPWYLKPLLRMEWKRTKKYERNVFDRFEARTIISEQDRALIDHPSRKKISIIPNGVDTQYFSPRKAHKDVELLFTGNMSYPPNVEAACFLANEVLPLVRKSHPEARLLISGANPAPRVARLQSDAVQVSGWVEDIRDSYARAQLFVAPMHIGTGLQNKLLEAMAMGLPCVTSPLANNALQAREGKEILIASSAAEYASTICNLLKNKQQQASLAQAGNRFARANFDWAAQTGALEQLMDI